MRSFQAPDEKIEEDDEGFESPKDIWFDQLRPSFLKLQSSARTIPTATNTKRFRVDPLTHEIYLCCFY